MRYNLEEAETYARLENKRIEAVVDLIKILARQVEQEKKAKIRRREELRVKVLMQDTEDRWLKEAHKKL